MKRVKKLGLAVFALAFIISTLMGAVPAFAETAQNNAAEIVGIDYNRITQKADGGKKSYPVTLKLGDLMFSGELYGEFGLTYEELNQIIRDVLKEKNLTVERVALVAKIAARAQTDAGLYWGDKLLENLLSFVPSPLPAGVGVNDYYAYVVHDEIDPALKSAAQSKAEEAAGEVLKAAAKTTGKVGRVAKAVSGAAGKVPMLGAIVNTVKYGLSWQDGTKRLDDYLALLEENLAVVNDFYATCSTRAVDLAEGRNASNVWKIRFDGRKNYRTYNCTFWGIPNNMMSCILSGELESAGSEIAGTYTGTLWLEFEAIDMSPVEQNFERTSGLNEFNNVLYSHGAYHKVSDAGTKTVLRREVQGELTVNLTETSGTVSPKVTGSLTSGGDETEFNFSRHIVWHDDTMAAYGSQGITDMQFTGSEIGAVQMKGFSRVVHNGAVLEGVESDEVFPQDPGTVFAPLESAPVITVNFE